LIYRTKLNQLVALQSACQSNLRAGFTGSPGQLA
jgi:hypothetical protein